MPRKYPPTPSASTGPIAEEKLGEMEGAFVLPPAAIARSPPTSPVIQRKRTLSGSGKSKEELPPPPSRARKIIQMKPKEELPTPSSSTAKSNSPKRKQPSATSAAGRKIARKTAHSIIERRRRSKMNEEFGVLKDMIPACKGVEMHKLAILQAGIEYVKYLQGCVDKLQDQRMAIPFVPRPHVLQDDDEEEDDDEDMGEESRQQTPSASPPPPPHPSLGQASAFDYRRPSTASITTTATSAQPSPAIRPNMSSSSLSSQRQLPPLTSKTYSTSPPPLSVQTPVQTGVSPAFNAIQFNPDLGRTYSHTTHSYHYSPSILPLPKAAMSMGAIAVGQPMQDNHAEATATAALMMLTNDRRTTGDPVASSNTTRTGGMSVRDLLSH